MTGVLILACPSCGTSISLNQQVRWTRCESCQQEHVVRSSGSMPVLAPVEPELERIQKKATRDTALFSIRALNLEILDLQAELDSLTKEGTPLDLTRAVGFSVIVLGMVYLVLFGEVNLNVMSLAAVGVALGAVLHGSTEFIGHDYYLRKTYLSRLIHKKQVQVFEYEQVIFKLSHAS